MPLAFSLGLVAFTVLIAPGFLSVLTAISIGVIERDPTRFEVLVASFVSGIVINVVFLSLYQFIYGSISSPSAIESVFFSSRFKSEIAIGYLILPVVIGLLYSLELARLNLRHRVRNLVWRGSTSRRYRRQPWQGTMENSTRLRILTADDRRIVGRIEEYSRVEKPRQLWLTDIYWVNPSNGELIDDNTTDSVLLLEEDIIRVVVLD